MKIGVHDTGEIWKCKRTRNEVFRSVCILVGFDDKNIDWRDIQMRRYRYELLPYERDKKVLVQRLVKNNAKNQNVPE